MKQTFVVLGLLLVALVTSHFLSDFGSSKSLRDPNATRTFLAPSSTALEGDLAEGGNESSSEEGSTGEDHTTTSAPAQRQSLAISGSGLDDVGKLVSGDQPGTYLLYGSDGKLVETIRQVGGSDQFVRQKDGVEIGTVTKVGEDRFNVYNNDGALVDTRQIRKN